MTIPKTSKLDANTNTAALNTAMLAANPVAAKAWTDLMSESARFMTSRLQHDLETQKAIMACKSPTDLMQVQSDFMKTAMEQYTQYATRCYEGMTAAVGSTAKDSKARSYDDVPL